ncbi:MAG: isoprenoid biosynthesis glyoxalase ElbB [Idiomarina sp.]|nr:isoprenoid biosynthesis glyoxalase ElbB [Idiomarina sp.]
MKKIAVLLSGCGVFDGSEIYETVITLLAVERNGATYQCFAPAIDQLHVIDHTAGEATTEKRNVLVEAARLARGEIKPCAELNVNEFDALLIPGGFGAAKNFSDFAVNGQQAKVEPSVLEFCKAFASAKKPAGYMCIAPNLLPFVYGQGVRLTIGNDKETAQALEALGAVHVNCAVDDIVIDEPNNLVTTPAYMLATRINEAATGIEMLVAEVIRRCE